MQVSYLALLVGVLGVVYGLASSRMSERQTAIGAVALLVIAIAIIVVPLALGVPW